MITCNIYLLKPSSISHYSKITFVLILGLTLLTVILIIFSGNDKSNSKEKAEKNDDDNSLPDLIEDKQTSEEQNYSQTDEDLFDDDIVTLEDVEESGEIDTKPLEEAKKLDDNKNEPEGLFSNLTGFGWESYLTTRLNNEINRAIASEMDISLFIIKLKNLERTNPLTKKICDYIATQFQFRDLLFEYKEDCLVAINTGANLEEALDFADKLYAEIEKMLAETEAKCYIGITTRSVRMISAERFINEAEQALNHAEESGSDPIIAFKADIEKYRKYVEQKFDE